MPARRKRSDARGLSRAPSVVSLKSRAPRETAGRASALLRSDATIRFQRVDSPAPRSKSAEPHGWVCRGSVSRSYSLHAQPREVTSETRLGVSRPPIW